MSTHMILKIEGMTCDSCSRGITARLSKFDFTENVNVNWESGKAELDLKSPSEENKEKVVNAVNQLGYKVLEVKTD